MSYDSEYQSVGALIALTVCEAKQGGAGEQGGL